MWSNKHCWPTCSHDTVTWSHFAHDFNHGGGYGADKPPREATFSMLLPVYGKKSILTLFDVSNYNFYVVLSHFKELTSPYQWELYTGRLREPVADITVGCQCTTLPYGYAVCVFSWTHSPPVSLQWLETNYQRVHNLETAFNFSFKGVQNIFEMTWYGELYIAPYCIYVHIHKI